jgi:hypothetical protein
VDKNVCYLCPRCRPLRGPFCQSRNLQSATLLLLSPPWSSMALKPRDPQLPRSPLYAPPGDLDFPLHPHPIVEPGLRLPHSSIGALPTFTGLRRWGGRASVNCLLCGNLVKQTLFHVLVHCKHTLDQGKLTWRHDSVLNHISGSLGSALVGKSMVKLSNQGWVCSLYLIKVGARGHIVKSVKDRLRSLIRAWLPAGHGSGVGQMMGDVGGISLV